MKILRIWSLIKECNLYIGTNHEREARFVEVNPYDAESLEKFIPEIKDLLVNLLIV